MATSQPARRGRRRRPIRVLHVAAELFPWVKTGGLGDVIAALPTALAEAGAEIRVILPGFSSLLDALRPETAKKVAHDNFLAVLPARARTAEASR